MQMDTKKSKIVETLSGTGKVYKDDKAIANVRYKLQIRQQFILTTSSSGEEEIPGLREITGQISVIEGERNLVNRKVLTLHLVDGRTWQFYAVSGDPITGMYSAVNASGEGLH
jgi:hypothetical protein